LRELKESFIELIIGLLLGISCSLLFTANLTHKGLKAMKAASVYN